MQKVTILCVGKLKEKFYIDAAAEYVKRLSRFCKLELVELPEERLPEAPSPAQIEAALLKEAAAIRAKLPSGAALIALCVEGEPRSSEALPGRWLPGPARRGTSGVSHRWVLWPAPLHQSRGQAAALHVSHDLPPPSGPGDGAGTDLPGVSDQRRHQISQVKDVEL